MRSSLRRKKTPSNIAKPAWREQQSKRSLPVVMYLYCAALTSVNTSYHDSRLIRLIHLAGNYPERSPIQR